MIEAGLENKRDSDLLRGVLDMCVLGVLATRPTHAYEVVERLRGLGFGAVSYGTIYPLVTRLRDQGLVAQESIASPVGPTRKVLVVTDSGRVALAAWRTRWEESTAAVRRVLAQVDDSQAGSS